MTPTRTLFASLLACSVALPAGTWAQPDAHRGGDRPPMGDRDHAPSPRHDGPPPRSFAGDRRDARDDHDDHGGGPDHAFHRGGRLPPDYRSRQYVVDDWRGHHLSAPPRGYQWVQTGADYVLVAVATGIIAQVLLGN